MARTRTSVFRRAATPLVIGAGVMCAMPEPVFADPPPWAPAHGWRRKNDQQYVGYTGSKWDKDYGIIAGRCDRQAVGAVVGGIVGGAIGSQVGKGNGNAVATVLGVVIGSVIGAEIAKDVDNGDRACIGHSLELAAANAQIRWVNPTTKVSYVLTPLGGYKQDGHICREFTLNAANGRQSGTGRAFACQSGDGSWQLTRKETGQDNNPGKSSKGKGRGKQHKD